MICFLQFRVQDSNTYYFGMTIAVVSSVLLLGNVLARNEAGAKLTPFDRLLRSAPFEFIGKRSYSLYLWQNLVMFWLTGPLHGSFWWWPANVAVSFACAEISYRFIELRFLKSHQPKEVRSTVATTADSRRPAAHRPTSAFPVPTSPADAVLSGEKESAHQG
jgi:peptidoglycan/LPS O-acetylase OafA/YrhL